MIALEAHFLDMTLELAAMRQPVTPTDALALINSMISTSNLSDVIIAWKKKTCQEPLSMTGLPF
jgi:hypothetical protein